MPGQTPWGRDARARIIPEVRHEREHRRSARNNEASNQCWRNIPITLKTRFFCLDFFPIDAGRQVARVKKLGNRFHAVRMSDDRSAWELGVVLECQETRQKRLVLIRSALARVVRWVQMSVLETQDGLFTTNYHRDGIAVFSFEDDRTQHILSSCLIRRTCQCRR
jgi:hypothetical protein